MAKGYLLTAKQHEETGQTVARARTMERRGRRQRRRRPTGGSGAVRSTYVTARILVTVPARADQAAGVAATLASGQIVAVCAPRDAGENPVTIAGLVYDFSAASAGDIVVPESGGLITLANVSLSSLNYRADPYVYVHAKYLGEAVDDEDPPWYEAISPLELRTLKGYDATKNMSIGHNADAGADAIEHQEDGPCTPPA